MIPEGSKKAEAKAEAEGSKRLKVEGQKSLNLYHPFHIPEICITEPDEVNPGI